jgi:hypothetical protein
LTESKGVEELSKLKNRMNQIEQRQQQQQSQLCIQPVVSTEAEVFQTLVKSNLIVSNRVIDKDLNRMLFTQGYIKSGNIEDLENELDTLLPLGSGEKSVVQPYFSDFVNTFFTNKKELSFYQLSRNNKQFNAASSLTMKLTSIPSSDAFNHVSFCGRKPDIVSYQSEAAGSLSIVVVGDLKPRDSNHDFTDQQKGHLIDFMRTLLTEVQPFRKMLYGVLSDCVRFQFIRAVRGEKGVIFYEISQVYRSILGHQLFISLFFQPLWVLGFEEFSIRNVSLKEFLGQGLSCYAFKGTFHQDSSVVVKVYKDTQSYDREKASLERLKASDILNVPVIVNNEALLTDQAHHVLLLSPVGSIVQPLHDGWVITSEHIVKLIETIERTHIIAQLLHRDIKPSNIFINSATNEIILNDWSSAIPFPNDLIPFHGTYGFYRESDIILLENSKYHYPTATTDLIAMIRSIYLMIFNLPAPTYIVSDIDEFWNSFFRTNTIWHEALKFCERNNYEGLKQLFRRLK